jgi:hypothetical protein
MEKLTFVSVEFQSPLSNIIDDDSALDELFELDGGSFTYSCEVVDEIHRHFIMASYEGAHQRNFVEELAKILTLLRGWSAFGDVVSIHVEKLND